LDRLPLRWLVLQKQPPLVQVLPLWVRLSRFRRLL